MNEPIQQVSYQNRYEHWVISLYDAAPEPFSSLLSSSSPGPSSFPEYIVDYLRCPACSSMPGRALCCLTQQGRWGDVFLYLFRCRCGKYFTVKNYIDYGERVPWPDNSGIPVR